MSDLKTLLTGIYADTGKLDGETVVSVVQDAGPSHPLYHRFEWDNGIAGHKYRVSQAERMIRRVKIETRPTTLDDGPHFVRAFVSNRQAGRPDQNGFSPIDEVMQDPLARQMLLRSFKRQVAELQRRFGHLEEYAAVMIEAAQAS